MVCVNKKLEEMLQEIGDTKKVKSDTIVPFNFYSADFHEFKEDGEFHWLRQYESQLTEFLKGLSLPIELKFDRTSSTPVQSALENAYAHGLGKGGNQCDFNLPITLEIFLGMEGIVFTVTDSGKGFDFEKVVKMKRDGEKYFNACRGDGFEVYDLPFNSNGNVPYEVSGEGSRINIKYMFKPVRSPLI